MAAPQVNGDVPSVAHNSAFLEHLLNYPVISDGVHTFKANEYGQKSIKLGDSAYRTFAVPVLPYLSKPYQFVSPYLVRADTFGDHTLDKLDARFPAVKKPTNELYNETRGFVLFPYQLSLEGRDHVYDVYSTEYKKNGQQGIVAYGKAAVTTVLVVSNETLSWLSSYLGTKKAEATQIANDKINH